MKLFSLFVLLALLLGSFPLVVKANTEIEVARDSAVSFITEAVRSFSKWEGSTPVDAQIYHDLDGQIVAYMFTVKKRNEVLGRIVVGGPEHKFKVLEGGNAIPPMLPSRSEIEETLQRDQGILLCEDETLGALQEFAGCNHTIPTHNPVTTRKRSVIPTNTQFLATFRDTEGVARQNPKDPHSESQC
jgi:hypothetical protein